jgi:hypothetical protein
VHNKNRSKDENAALATPHFSAFVTVPYHGFLFSFRLVPLPFHFADKLPGGVADGFHTEDFIGPRRPPLLGFALVVPVHKVGLVGFERAVLQADALAVSVRHIFL